MSSNRSISPTIRSMLQFTAKAITMQTRLLQPPTIRGNLLLLHIEFIIVIVIAIVGICQSADSERPPNIIFILADDLVSEHNKQFGFTSFPFPSLPFLLFRVSMMSAFVDRHKFPRPISMPWHIRVSYSIVTMSIQFAHHPVRL